MENQSFDEISVAYAIYKKEVGGKTWDDKPMKEFSEMPENIQNAWLAIDDYYKNGENDKEMQESIKELEKKVEILQRAVYRLIYERSREHIEEHIEKQQKKREMITKIVSIASIMSFTLVGYAITNRLFL
jgi:phosphate uptake regulator